ncbi:hypothetical protein CHCC15292_4609 [Bacillus licheniformis]|nr:hypothetical protein CHCC15292_4609 [Bacillus licheniformis]
MLDSGAHIWSASCSDNIKSSIPGRLAMMAVVVIKSIFNCPASTSPDFLAAAFFFVPLPFGLPRFFFGSSVVSGTSTITSLGTMSFCLLLVPAAPRPPVPPVLEVPAVGFPVFPVFPPDSLTVGCLVSPSLTLPILVRPPFLPLARVRPFQVLFSYLP